VLEANGCTHVFADISSELRLGQPALPKTFSPIRQVDYSKWLGEEVASSLSAQAEVMRAISMRKQGPAVHGYIGFDPLRQVYYRHGYERESPLAIVRRALEMQGFIGVKLYPPMGFKPAGNGPGQTYPEVVLETIGRTLSDDLNQALDELYQLCVDLDAPILAHGADLNGAGPDYAERADPTFWLPVFAKFRTLRVCLAHFGRISYRAAGAPAGLGFPEASWEWALGQHLRRDPQAQVFADLSYFSDILSANAERRQALARDMGRFIREFDPDVHHLMFGTDWIMMGLESQYPAFAAAVAEFLSKDCALSDLAVQRVFVGNAERFLGLRPGDGARRRLLAFYRAHGVSPKI
jgi:predicted TIM-barrel fold metal-dependent hydrolase